MSFHEMSGHEPEPVNLYELAAAQRLAAQAAQMSWISSQHEHLSSGSVFRSGLDFLLCLLPVILFQGRSSCYLFFH